MLSTKRLQKMKTVAEKRRQDVVVLEDIYDPHNAAAVLRTADAFGIQKIYFIFQNQKKFNPKKVGQAAASSANKWLEFESFDSTEKCFKKLKQQGYHTIATVLDNKAKSIFKSKFKVPKIALCFGNEHSGLSPAAVAAADEHLYIPMQGFVQSLNLSVTAAICMFEAFRQRQKFGVKFLFSKQQQNTQVAKWKKV